MRNDELNQDSLRRMRKRHTRGKIIGGLLLVTAGLLFLAREMNMDIPNWVFTWKMLLIAIGLAAGAKRGYAPGGWMIVTLVGLGFLVADLFPWLEIRPFLLPAFLIIVGLFVIFKPFRPHHHYWRHWKDECDAKKKGWEKYDAREQDDFIEATTVFGGVRKNVNSKTFRGGDVTNVMGATEINLMHADFEGEANLEITQVMGGTRLIVPAHWQVRSSLTAVLGNVEDKRSPVPAMADAAKVLNLTGTSVLGGIEIRSL